MVFGVNSIKLVSRTYWQAISRLELSPTDAMKIQQLLGCEDEAVHGFVCTESEPGVYISKWISPERGSIGKDLE